MKIEIINNKFISINESIYGPKIIDASEIEKQSLLILKRKIRKNGSFILLLNMAETKKLNLILKKYYHLYKYCIKHCIPIGERISEKINLAYISNGNEDELSKIKEFFYVLLIGDIKLKYNYIYDRTCEELDDIFRSKNLCDFRNDSCINQRTNRTKHKTMGCCYSFYYGKDGLPVNTGLCEHLSDKGCKVKCLECKMFTCKYLRKKGIKFAIKDFVLLDAFLNKKQKKYLEEAFFKTQEEIVGKWIEDYTD